MPAPKRNRGWLWYFLILVVLTLAATIGLAVYNYLNQLRPEQFEAAREQWAKHKHEDYTLVYQIKNKDDHVDQYHVKVRQGKAVEATFNGLAEPTDRLHHYGMERLFVYLEQFMDIDQKKGSPRVFCRAIFDQDTGGLLWYVRRVMGGQERVEITVTKLQKD